MRVGEALWEELADRPYGDRVTGWGSTLGFFQGRAESAAAAARAAGVPPSTWRRWLQGAMPRADRLASVVAAARAAQARSLLSHQREQNYRDAGDLVVFGTWNYEPGKGRRIGLGSYLTDGWTDDVVDAFLNGSAAAELHAELHAHINDQGFYEATFNPRAGQDFGWDVTGVEWE